MYKNVRTTCVDILADWKMHLKIVLPPLGLQSHIRMIIFESLHYMEESQLNSVTCLYFTSPCLTCTYLF